MTSFEQPKTRGLYRSDYEHDACGVGFICSIHANHSHYVIEQGLTILERLDHRGARGSDAETGDGAGILSHIPHSFFSEYWSRKGISLPTSWEYGVGNIFLSKNPSVRDGEIKTIEAVIEQEGLILIGWREVPVVSECIGEDARSTEPATWQFFVKGEENTTLRSLERKLFVLRKAIENAFLPEDSKDDNDVYITSLSNRTIVYKGMLTPDQLGKYFPDLHDPLFESAIAMVHSRFSTNTFPQWSLAQPFRSICHNGEINTLRGNVNWMRARQGMFASEEFGANLEKIFPLFTEGGSDSQALDNALEVIWHTGRSLPRAMMMMIPEAWEHNEEMNETKRAFYDFHSCVMEPWDGPATVPFTDGRYIGAVLDRNGLRPSRYIVTKDGFVVLSSEAGVIDVEPENVVLKGRVQPGKMFLVDLKQKRIISDEEIKMEMAQSQPYKEWVDANMIHLESLPGVAAKNGHLNGHHGAQPTCNTLQNSLKLFGYTKEDQEMLLPPMFLGGKEALGSMGDDTPLAVLSERPRLLYDYFKQLFAQVTNPPLDAIREVVVTSLFTSLGSEGNLFEEKPEHARRIRLKQPILTSSDLGKIKSVQDPYLRHKSLPIFFAIKKKGYGLKEALQVLCDSAEEAVNKGYSLLVLSDRAHGVDNTPIPALLATAAVHHRLIKSGLRTRCSLIVESGEPREVHHMGTLIGYGADAICPYLAIQAIKTWLSDYSDEEVSASQAIEKYIKSIGKGLLKIMSKMGISTIQSYQGAQIFEAVGISQEVIDPYFTSTATRIGGIDLQIIAEETAARFYNAYREQHAGTLDELDAGGRYRWRRDGEHHHYNPQTVATLQNAARYNSAKSYTEFSQLSNNDSKRKGTLRGLLSLASETKPIPLDEVEPWTEIVKRFKTGAMSYGSISREAHESLAVAMNMLGGKSNTGEGGEDPDRYAKESERRSRIKQVASGRFGVTISYLASADEIQIKMAQGAKPGEGGQLPAKKVYPWIAKVRHSTPYVGLISPPPHHDIYSIEDLAQLIFDLKNTNPGARVSVKLVSEMGVGTIAAGVAKGKADVILISGSDGGTGASPQTSVMHAGLPWELGLAETHQTLVLNGLRNRVRIECDGQLKTGLDVAIACLLGAEEFGFATAPLVAMGCIMMRKCHLNTCPVGIATQDPALREKFAGSPEHVVNYFHFVAEELREIMAQLGIRSIDEMKGRVDLLSFEKPKGRWKAQHLDLQALLYNNELPASLQKFDATEQIHDIDNIKDRTLIEQAQPALQGYNPVVISTKIQNSDRAFGTMLSGEIARQCGLEGLPDDTITINATGSAGQSLGAFGAKGMTINLDGEVNDYLGKGLSGAKIIVRPPSGSTFDPAQNIIAGNVALYGATSGRVYVNGCAGERFAVRNSGVHAVVEGVGDHGCEYMTGGKVVILGSTGRNFAAGMSGGIAYVYDEEGSFAEKRCNLEMVEIERLEEESESLEIVQLIEEHYKYTQSPRAKEILCDWKAAKDRFVKVIPTEYKRALALHNQEQEEAYIEPPPAHLAA
ncbi:MAG: glutamate synthase large subunit [Rhodothermaceae bacterium]|nr:glutamate synthase large subunit [Rhodothermaceae bacterium]